MRVTRQLVVLSVAATFAGSALAADYPNKPINMIVGYGAGGGPDTYARALASVAPDFLNGQPMIVVNKPGGGSIPAAKFVADQNPDGYTLHMGSGGTLTLKNLVKPQKVEPIRDFKAIAVVGGLVAGLFVPADSPFKTAKDLVAHAKANPGKLRWGHPSRGSSHYNAGTAFMQKNGFSAKDVPFKGGAGTRAALIGKQVDYAFIGIHLIKGFTSKVRALGVSRDTRDPINNSVPTFKEQGLGYVQFITPMTVFGPKKMSDANVNYLAGKIKEMTKHKAFKGMLTNAGLPIFYMDPAESLAFLKQMKIDWLPVVESIKAAKKKKAKK
jgi:tripartite-type tricarboxylate transporter receptor subunit TctC